MYGTQNRMNNAWYITMYKNIHIYTTRESHPIYALFDRFILVCHYRIPILRLKNIMIFLFSGLKNTTGLETIT